MGYICELEVKDVFVQPTAKTQVIKCRTVVLHPILLLLHKLSRESGSSLAICLCEVLDTDAQI